RLPPSFTLFPYTTLFRSEGVVAQAESGVALGARTGAERTAIELAKEAHARFGVGKAEGGAGLVRGVGRCGGDRRRRDRGVNGPGDRKSTRLNSSHVAISY